MLKRAAAYLLSFCIVFSMFVQFVPSVFAQEITPWSNPEMYVECEAEFATEDKAEPGMAFQSFICVADPASVKYEDLYASGATTLPLVYETEVKDIKVVIKDYYISDEDMLWFKVEAAAGSTMPATLQNNPWVMYMINEEDYPSLLIEAPQPTVTPTVAPTAEPTAEPTATPTAAPSATPTAEPSQPTDTEGENITPPQLDPRYQIEEINRKGYFEKENVTFYKNPLGTSYTVTLATADLPQRVDVAYKVTDTGLQTPVSWYLLANTQSWQGIESWQYCYVLVEDVILADDEPETDPAVQQAFESLMATTTVDEFEELRDELGIEIFRQFTTEQLDQLDQHYNAMVEAETLTYETEVMYKGVAVPVTVTGLIPQGLTLSVHAASDETVLNGGFAVDKAEDIALALDIKLLDADSNEWQPKAGRTVIVSMGVTALGYQDGRIFQLEHKHGDIIERYDVFIVTNGKITVKTNGFSAYVVTDSSDRPARADRVADSGNGGTADLPVLVVGQDPVYYYIDVDENNLNRTNDYKGTWQVDDPNGNIYYEIYLDGAQGNQGVLAPWIKVVPLKETAQNEEVTLRFTYGNVSTQWNGSITNAGVETYKLKIVKPTAKNTDPGGYKLYFKDTVNTNGCISIAVTDTSGEEVSVEGASCTWTRSDNVFIVPQAYENGGHSINVARDHSGLVQDRLNKNGNIIDNAAITYTAKVTMPDGTKLEDTYTVYYQSEILNSSFEYPLASNKTYTFFVNGQSRLYWKTTSPGTGNNITRDIEYVSYNGNGNWPQNVTFWPNSPPENGGNQIAEVNAENVGALYQDIITVPGEKIEWNFMHSKRDADTDRESRHEAMFVIFGATEDAQKILDFTDIQNLLSEVTPAQREYMHETGNSMKIEDPDEDVYALYEIWYHDADEDSTRANEWNEIKGTYKVPTMAETGKTTDQYRTRIFFVTDPKHPKLEDGEQMESNYGNLIDAANVGQYRRFLVEYYEESHVKQTDGTFVYNMEYKGSYKEEGRALIYSSYILENYDHFTGLGEGQQHDYLGEILINGQNYPYDIRYGGQPALYIDKYEGEARLPEKLNRDADHPAKSNADYYGQYDIVMQIFLTDTLVSAEKFLEFPAELTVEQKLQIIQGLENGYRATVNITDKKEGDIKFCDITEDFIIKNPNPDDGSYTSYIVLGEDHRADDIHTFTELSTTEMPGLTLVKTKYDVKHYSHGEHMTQTTNPNEGISIYNHITKENEINKELGNKSTPIYLQNTGTIIIDSAAIKVTNTYEEKEVTVKYEAVGNGKVSWKGDAEPNYKDSPKETVKFYSGDPRGASVHAAGNAVFAGWYKDKECTQEITAADGKYIKDETDLEAGTKDRVGDFEPNIHVINEESVTFYAKFITRSLTVERVVTAADIGQTFVYHIKGSNGSNVDMYITMEVKPEDIKADGTSKISRTIYEVPTGRYDVFQLKDWSWRYDPEESQFVQHTGVTNEELEKTVTFKEPRTIEKWLSGLSEIAHNIGGKGGTT